MYLLTPLRYRIYLFTIIVLIFIIAYHCIIFVKNNQFSDPITLSITGNTQHIQIIRQPKNFELALMKNDIPYSNENNIKISFQILSTSSGDNTPIHIFKIGNIDVWLKESLLYATIEETTILLTQELKKNSLTAFTLDFQGNRHLKITENNKITDFIPSEHLLYQINCSGFKIFEQKNILIKNLSIHNYPTLSITNKKLTRRIIIGFTSDHLDKLQEVRIQIGTNIFSYNRASFLKLWQPIKLSKQEIKIFSINHDNRSLFYQIKSPPKDLAHKKIHAPVQLTYYFQSPIELNRKNALYKDLNGFLNYPGDLQLISRIIIYSLKNIFLLIIGLVLSFLFWQDSIYQKKIGTKNNKRTDIFYLITCNVIVLFPLLLICNKYFPLTDGWWSLYAKLINQGKIPYRDFYMCLPPLYPLIIAKISSFFGNNFIVLRVFGLVIISITVSGLYLLFRKLFHPTSCLLLSIVSTFSIATWQAFLSHDFNICIFALTVFIALFFTEWIESRGIYNFILLILSGILTGSLFLTKQNAGLLCFFTGILVILIMLFNTNFINILKSIFFYSIGFLMPIFFIYSWLLKNNAISQFFQQTFLDGINNKGSILFILLGFIPSILNRDVIINVLLTTSVIISLGYTKTFWKLRNPNSIFKKKSVTLSIFTSIFFILSIFYIHSNPFDDPFPFSKLIENIQLTIPTTLFIYSLWFFLQGYKILGSEKNISIIEKQYWTIITFGLLMISFGTTSGRVINQQVIPIALGAVFGRLIQSKSYLNLGTVLTVTYIFLSSLLNGTSKFAMPYAWWGYSQASIHDADTAPQSPLLKHFILPSEVANMLDAVSDTIQKNSNTQDKIFTFPNIPLFYLLGNRSPLTFAPLHWYDATSDWASHADAKIILKNPPKVMIIFDDVSDFVINSHENLFRNGNASGQRDILAAIRYLTIEKSDYILNQEYAFPGWYRLKVWIKRESHATL